MYETSLSFRIVLGLFISFVLSHGSVHVQCMQPSSIACEVCVLNVCSQRGLPQTNASFVINNCGGRMDCARPLSLVIYLVIPGSSRHEHTHHACGMGQPCHAGKQSASVHARQTQATHGSLSKRVNFGSLVSTVWTKSLHYFVEASAASGVWACRVTSCMQMGRGVLQSLIHRHPHGG